MLNIKINLGNIPKGKVYADLKAVLTAGNLSIKEPTEISFGLQCEISRDEQAYGFLRIYESVSKGTSIDFSQVKSQEIIEVINECVHKGFDLTDREAGKTSLPQRFMLRTESILDKIKQTISSEFKGKLKSIPSTDKHHYIFKIDGCTVNQYKSGMLVIQGKSTKLSDRLIDSIRKTYQENSFEEISQFIKPQIKKVAFEELIHDLNSQQIDTIHYITKEVYNQLYANDCLDIRDGIVLLEYTKKNKLQFSNYVILVRNFAVVYEGFLIKLFTELGLINEQEFMRDERAASVGRILNNKEGASKFSAQYNVYFDRRYPYLASKMYDLWLECRNKYLHSDVYAAHVINSVENSESKIRELIDVMEKCVEVFKGKLKPAKPSDGSFNYAGTDESGKGDYFGPLVIAGVHVTSEDQIKNLTLLGVRDSKELSDNQVLDLSPKIKNLCSHNIVAISPYKYNELYNKIQNLNRLLAWGHARVIENLLDIAPCDYIISDQFGDESFIKDALMQRGKKIFLDQHPKAEEDIVVAAASVLARAEFLERLSAQSTEFKMDFPKGASDKVIASADEFVKVYGPDRLKDISKLHFSTTKKVNVNSITI